MLKNKIAVICFAIFLLFVLVVSINPFENPSGTFFAVAIVVAITIYVLTKNNFLKRLPEFTTKATVVEKKVVVEEEFVSCDSDGNSVFNETSYYRLTFKTGENVHWIFNVSLDLYNAVTEGDSGTLVYKKSKRNKVFFVSFSR